MQSHRRLFQVTVMLHRRERTTLVQTSGEWTFSVCELSESVHTARNESR